MADDEFLRRPASSLHWMHHHDAECIEAIFWEKLPESCATALRAAGCEELADDWRLCVTLLWIAAADLTTFEELNHSMGGTIGLASGRIRDFVHGLGDGSYLAVDQDWRRYVHGFALTEKGRFATEILRSPHRTN